MREFGFELSLCARLEAGSDPKPASEAGDGWTPGGDDGSGPTSGSEACSARTPGSDPVDGEPVDASEDDLPPCVPAEPIVARQLGAGVAAPGGRVVDAVVLEPGPAFDERAALTDATIDPRVVESGLGPGRARSVTGEIDAPPEHAIEIAETAAEAGFLEPSVRGGELCARQVARYPEDWFGDLVGIENKPDLGTPGNLETQLRTDVSLAVFDHVVLATESYVTGAHLNRLPDAVGVWRFDPDAAVDGDAESGHGLEVVRPAERLPVGRPGVEVLERSPGRTDVEVVSPAAIEAARLRIAERAYGKGWRPVAFPGCERVGAGVPGAAADGECAAESGSAADSEAIPYCSYKDRIVEPARECGEACPGFAAAEPPTVDAASERAERTPWVHSPAGKQRRQAGLDRFE